MPTFFFFSLFIYSHVHTLFGSFLHPASVSGRSRSALITDFVEERQSVFVVELRIAIQKDSYYCFRVPMCYDPCRLNSN
jgi:hypothetical protein